MLQYVKKVWFILGDSRKQLPYLLLIFTISSILETVGIGMLGPFFAIVSDPALIETTPSLKQVSILLGATSSQTFIIYLCGFIIVLFVAKSIIYFLSKLYILRFSNSHLARMIQKLNRAYLYSDYNYFIGKNSSTLIKNVVYETKAFRTGVMLAFLYGISNLFILAFLLILMATTDLLLLVTTLAAILPLLLLTYAMKYRLRRWGKDASTGLQGVIVTLSHGLGGFKETRVVGCAPYFEEQMKSTTQQYARADALINSFDMLPRILFEMVLVILIVSFVAVSQLLQFRSSDALISSLSVFALASIRLLPAVSQLISVFNSLQNTRHSVDIIYADLQEAEDQLLQLSRSQGAQPPLGATPSRAMDFNHRIQLSTIFYRYAGAPDPAINGISLDIRKGESIAFIGKSGAGKTTLVDIILGLLTPQQGDITVDGVSIYTDLRSWQNLVGYIPQSIFLLDDTVERNVAFGVPDGLIDRHRLKQAIAAAELEDFVSQLPKGLKTRVGERGVMLSGGQRQRIGIARALYHEREILVLDEATSALDNETEKKVSEAIQALSGQKTVIIIAHRLSTVEQCDRVYMLERGQVVRSGSFAEVVKRA